MRSLEQLLYDCDRPHLHEEQIQMKNDSNSQACTSNSSCVTVIDSAFSKPTFFNSAVTNFLIAFSATFGVTVGSAGGGDTSPGLAPVCAALLLENA
jgi:hypothetical protein